MDACRGIDANLGCESEAERAGRASAGSCCASPKSAPSSPLCGCTSNASAASTITSHRPSRGPPRPAPRASICERFFFEELRTCLGEEQASQWLLSVPLTDKHRSAPPRTMRRSETLPNLQAGDTARGAGDGVLFLGGGALRGDVHN